LGGEPTFDADSTSQTPDAASAFFSETPIGSIGIAADGDAITHIVFSTDKGLPGTIRETPAITDAARQIEEYLAGQRKDFNLTLKLSGTDFHRAVRDALRAIPYGETRTYGQIATSIGNPRACLAVGMANNRNPISIVVPCHRVIGAIGTLVGYGGGLDIKEHLLRLERARGGTRI